MEYLMVGPELAQPLFIAGEPFAAPFALHPFQDRNEGARIGRRRHRRF